VARIRKRRRDVEIDVALDVAPGASVALFGPSGAGKSTVLACLAGFESPDDGTITLGGRVLYPPQLTLAERGVGYLAQDAQLFGHLTVAQNVAYGTRGDAAWTSELRERFGLGDLWHASAARVSGGQARRIALARALGPRPALLLLDEPFAGLDRTRSRALLEDLRGWRARLGFALVAADHDAEALEAICERVLALDAGRVASGGTWPELRARPPTAALADLLQPLHPGGPNRRGIEA